MQTLPLVGFVLDRIGLKARALVLVAAIAQTGLAGALFMQALAGRPFWPPG